MRPVGPDGRSAGERISSDPFCRCYYQYRQKAQIATPRSGLVVVSVNLSPRECRGRLAVSSRVGDLVEDLAHRGIPIVVVSFGIPYLLDAFASVSTLLLAWNSSAQSQRAAARAALGWMHSAGKLPMSLAPRSRASALP